MPWDFTLLSGMMQVSPNLLDVQADTDIVSAMDESDGASGSGDSDGEVFITRLDSISNEDTDQVGEEHVDLYMAIRASDINLYL